MCFVLGLVVIPQQDVAEDGGGADQSAAEPEGGGGAPDAPRGRAAARGQPGHDRAHQGTCLPRAIVHLICHFAPPPLAGVDSMRLRVPSAVNPYRARRTKVMPCPPHWTYHVQLTIHLKSPIGCLFNANTGRDV